jgi:hypothetical protein
LAYGEGCGSAPRAQKTYVCDLFLWGYMKDLVYWVPDGWKMPSQQFAITITEQECWKE